MTSANHHFLSLTHILSLPSLICLVFLSISLRYLDNRTFNHNPESPDSTVFEVVIFEPQDL